MKIFKKEVMLKSIGIFVFKIILTSVIFFISLYAMLFISIFGRNLNSILLGMACLILPLLVTLVWTNKKRKKAFIIWLCFTLFTLISCGINMAIVSYRESLRIKTDVNINVYDYMPFEEDSKIVKLDEEATLKLKDNLPRVDGAAAVFPLYSAFVNEVYPKTVEYRDGTFEYNNTVGGYKLLGEKEIDIFFGAYPSKEQIETAKAKGTEFEYTEIGKEAFVFFVNKDNPVDNLTSEQIKDIYSGKITNWKEVGGNDEEILAFQRNEGSGSQSMLKRFMGDTPIMEAKTEQVNDFMMGIITQVADYKNYDNSIGFSFRYYLETLIANPNVKTVKIDGIAPTPETISNGTYGITTSLYAVTYKDNPNENVKLLIDWVLSDQGQELVEKTGYTRIK